ncbi:MAG: 16S rRNA (guanine(527)-N(7))-methyltransferase RsmG [Micavibrio aeruginosavorus]|uniref:Ribosomal RNA small subunit methyltransferase G n=1 Tax=Micavibrio aeruginosavorus TaxID=349221 RepID=A0A2W5C2U4_9BACT|nr:MAG: 16S rRNA (guanine(527)-N(7))-methyltransferase RsmG [Micavibrio aeruginosavorus]
MKRPNLSDFSVSRETEDKLRAYHAILLKWQKTINLISPKTVEDSWDRHFIDSVQILPLVPEHVKTIYDLGSGAGFPGMVFGICLSHKAVTLIESDSKKCAFLSAVSRETGSNVSIQNMRIEVATGTLPAPDLVSARALASLLELLNYIKPWIEKNPDLQALFPKGAAFAEEIRAARSAGWNFDCAETASVTDPDARILHLSRIKLGA